MRGSGVCDPACTLSIIASPTGTTGRSPGENHQFVGVQGTQKSVHSRLETDIDVIEILTGSNFCRLCDINKKQ